MAAPVIIGFATRGLPEVNRAFGSLEASMVRLERAGGQAAVKGAESRVKTTESERKAREAEYAAYSKFLTKAEEGGVSAARKAAEAKERIQESSLRKLEHELDASKRRETAIAEREALAQERAVQSVRKRMASTGGAAVMNGTGRAFGGLATLAGGALAIGGGFALGDAFRGEMAAERSASKLINLVTTGGTAPAGADIKSILAQAGATGIATGIDKQEILNASVAYAQNARGGDFKGIQENMSFFAKAAKVGGVDMSILTAGAGKLQSQNPDLGTAGMQNMILSAMGMAKSGSVSFEQAIGQVGTLASTRGMLAGDEATNQRKLIGLGQIAASGGESGDMGTYIKDVVYEIGAHRKKTTKETGLGEAGLESLGVTFDKQGKFDIGQAIGQMFKVTGGDLTKIHGIVGNRGMPAFTELSKAFNVGGGGEAGAKAVVAQMASMDSSTMTAGDLDKRLAETLSTPAERFGKASAQVTEILQAHLAPMLERVSSKLPAAVETFGRIVDAGGSLAEWFVANPITGIGALITASVSKDLAGAAIGAGVKVAIESALKGASGGTVGALGNVTAGFGLLSVAIGVTLAGFAALDAYWGKRAGDNTRNVTDQGGAEGAAHQALRPGAKMTPEQVAKMMAELKDTKRRKDRLDQNNAFSDAEYGPIMGVIDKVAGTDHKANDRNESSLLQQRIDLLTKALDKNTAATAADTKVAKTGGTVSDPARSVGMGTRAPTGGDTSG